MSTATKANPHVLMHLDSEDVHCTPRVVFERIASKEMPITDLEGWEDIIPRIVEEWLVGLGEI